MHDLRKMRCIEGLSSAKDPSFHQCQYSLTKRILAQTRREKKRKCCEQCQRFQIMVNSTTRNERQDRRTIIDILFCGDSFLEEKIWNLRIVLVVVSVLFIIVFEVFEMVFVVAFMVTPPAIFRIVKGVVRIYHRTAKCALKES